MARHLVVQQARGGVALVGQPIDLGGARLVGRVIDRVDQLARNAGAPAARIDEQVVEIASRRDQPGRAMEQVVREADELAVALRHQAINRFLLLEETIPGCARRLFGNARAIELLIALPQRQPPFEIRVAHRADDRVVALHGSTLLPPPQIDTDLLTAGLATTDDLLSLPQIPSPQDLALGPTSSFATFGLTFETRGCQGHALA